MGTSMLGEANTDQTVDAHQRTPNAEAVARYRAKHRRIDYMPSQASLDLILELRINKPGYRISGYIDALLTVARKALAGKSLA